MRGFLLSGSEGVMRVLGGYLRVWGGLLFGFIFEEGRILKNISESGPTGSRA